MRFLIIGGDAAGMSAASRAKRNRPDWEVTVLEKTLDVSYSACGMPYNIGDRDTPIETLIVRQAQVFREKQGIDLRTGHEAKSLDPVTRTVRGITLTGDPFALEYDQLLIATGASPITPEIPGINLPGVLVLKSLDDGRRIKAFLRERQVRRAVIVGMGYIALEMCEAFRSRGIAVTMVKPRSAFLPYMHEQLASVVRKELDAHGVDVHPGRAIHGIEREGDTLRVTCAGTTLEGEAVLIAAGIRPNSGLASGAGLALGPSEAIAVDPYLRSSDLRIYAAGDCADAFHVVTGQRVWIPLALRANRAGWAVADNVTGKPTALQGIAGTAVFKVFDLQVARTGLNLKEAAASGFDPAEAVIESRSRAHAHPGSSPIWVHMIGDKGSGRLLGVQMVGKEGVAHRINAAAVALHSRLTVEAFGQCDLAYAPPFGPVWDPLLTAAQQLMRRL
jgi:NADPH-dependent 2,4-dienoyl-CoA reductase/sulfur reductase-like enzyme